MTGVLESPVFPLGLPDPNLRLIGVSHTDTVTFGSGAVAARIGLGGSALTDTPSLGDGVISVGSVNLSGTGLSDTPSLGGGQLTWPQTLTGSAIVDTVTFGTGLATIGGITVLDDETDDFPVTFGQGAVQPGVRIIVDSSNDNFAPTFGSGAVAPGPVVLDGYGIWPDTKYGRGTVEPTRYYFVGPELRYGHGRKHSPLWWVENVDGITLLREGGVWRETLAPTGDEIAAAERAYRGGYRTELTGTQKNELVAAGYGSYIEED